MIQKKNNSFITGALIIAISNLLVKMIGAAFKIPLDRFILSAEGIGIYSSAYVIYNFLFVVSTAGIPVAISKMVAETQAKGHYAESKKILKISQLMLFGVGLTAFLALFFFAKDLSRLISAESSYLTMMVMSPSLFFVALASTYRGFYQGQQNMFPTAISEVIEALSKLVFGLMLALYFKNLYGQLHIASAGAIAGVSIGTCCSLIYLFIYNKIKIKSFKTDLTVSKSSSTKDILKRLIKISVPITLGVSVFTLTSLIDTATVLNQLYGLGYDESARNSLFGYLNRAITLFNMPPTVIAAIAISVVPAIAAALAVKNKENAITNAKSAIRITLLVAVPCGVGLSALAQPILQLIYADGAHHFLLTMMGLAVIFVTLVQVCNAILQAWSKVWVPVVNMGIGGIVKIIVNLLLVSRPEININGAPIGTLCCYFTVMCLNIYHLRKHAGIKFEITDFILKPLFCGALTAFCAAVSYRFAGPVLGNFIGIVLSIGIAGLGYLISLVIVKGIKKEDVLLLPKGDKLADILEKWKVIRA